MMEFKIEGQVHGGKNNMCITRTGRHYPNPKFVKWRLETMSQINAQKPRGFKPIEDNNLLWTFHYVPSDNRRRDVPAILDALFHCMEKCNIVTDDFKIANVYFFTLPVDKLHPRVGIRIQVVV